MVQELRERLAAAKARDVAAVEAARAEHADAKRATQAMLERKAAKIANARAAASAHATLRKMGAQLAKETQAAHVKKVRDGGALELAARLEAKRAARAVERQRLAAAAKRAAFEQQQAAAGAAQARNSQLTPLACSLCSPIATALFHSCCAILQINLYVSSMCDVLQAEEKRLASVQAGAGRALRGRQAGALREAGTLEATATRQRGVHLRHAGRVAAAKRDFVKQYDIEAAAQATRHDQVCLSSDFVGVTHAAGASLYYMWLHCATVLHLRAVKSQHMRCRCDLGILLHVSCACSYVPAETSNRQGTL